MNMEQVSLAPQHNGLYILNGQAVLIQNATQNTNISGSTNSDIFQPVQNGLSTVVGSQTIKAANGLGQNYVLLDNCKPDDDRVVQLSISDDFPLEMLDTFPKTDIGNDVSDSSLLKNIFAQGNNKTDNLSSPDLLSSFLKFTPKEKVANQFELVSPLKGNFTYAYQLSDGAKLCPVSTVGNGTSTVSIPVVTSGPDSKFSESAAVTSRISIPQVSSQQTARKVVYVNNILSGVNGKPRLILNMKSKGVPDQKKRITQKIQIVPSKDKSLLCNNLKTNSQKIEAVPIISSEEKEMASSKLIIQKDLSNNISDMPLLLNTLLTSKMPQNSQAGEAKNVSKAQVVQTDGPVQRSLLKMQLQQQKTPVRISPTVIQKEATNNEIKPVGRLTESQLKKIAAVFRNSCLNRTRLTNSTIFDTETNTRIVCRVVYPEDLVKDGEKQVTKRGKKRTRSVEVVKKSAPEDDKTKKPPPPSARTRSGRLSRPPRYMVKDFKKLTEDSEASYSDYMSDSDENSENSPLLPLPTPQQRKYPPKFHCPTCGKVYLGKRRMFKHFTEYPSHRDPKTVFELEDESQENGKQQDNERNLWRKIFRKSARNPKLDSKGLLKELFQVCSNNDLVPLAKEKVATNVEPWDYLKLRYSKEDGGVRTLLSDLSSLIKSIPTNLLVAAEPEDIGSIHIEDEKLCQLLGISPGHYMPNETSLKDDTPKEAVDSSNTGPNTDLKCDIQSTDNCWNLRNDMYSDEALKMEVDSGKMEAVDAALKDDSSELNEILLEKSLDSVDQIVSERLNDLIPTSPIDVSSLVEAQVLARSLLTSSPDLLQGVSGSTEDLMKTLENLTPDLPTDAAPSDFDFTVLSSDFTSDR
ncbi:uncharacterized protein [Halyomorpha halys]|uniref:uncharacterized protein isoform X1 n=1 Tax=Halyomorpha halys TaxID=286706 RepID=UPI0006D4FB9B|nr:uncharacterized protein LOC106677346 isoform X1 [Halyomorpha halys]